MKQELMFRQAVFGLREKRHTLTAKIFGEQMFGGFFYQITENFGK